MNLIYLRVSTKDQTELNQLPTILKGFNLNKDECLIFKDEVTAYNLDKEHKRKGFLELKREISTRKYNNLYVFDLDRIYRNREKTKEFFIYCDLYGVEIYSYNQTWLREFQDLKNKFPIEFKFLIVNIHNLLLEVYAKSAEDESRKKSERVKLSIKKNKKGVTISHKGKKWGRKNISKQSTTKILELHKKGLSVREISKQVFIYDKNNNPVKNVSVGTVHKTIKDNSQ